MTNLLQRARRSFAFARHIPPQRALRRVALTLKRALRDRAGGQAPVAAPPPLAGLPPQPLFAARTGMIDGETFTFLNRAHRMHGRVDWSAPSLASKDQLWRMNLHYMEYLEEVDDARFVSLIEDWILANPAARPGAWRDSHNAYALSLRVVVWMQQLARRRLPPTPAIAASLAEQMRFLEDNLETDLGGNHLIKNLKALIWASAFFAGKAAKRWRGLGLRLLKAELEAQILPDGVHFERSPSYHAQVFADLLECRHALGDAAPATLDEALKAMAQPTADLAHPDGGPAAFNDAGLTMAYAPAECLEAFAKLIKQTAAAAPVFAYPDAGYFGRREGGDCFIADCGRIGPDALPAHAHGDILSFELSLAGERIIVDPGVYEYIDGPRRRAARAAASHNTLSFDGLDQAEFFGAFRCARRPNVTVLDLVCEPGRLVVEGTHDGYRRHKHVRRFEQTSGALRILDRISGPPRAARIGFLLHPQVEARLESGGVSLMRDAARAEFRASLDVIVEDAVWWPDMGQERRTLRLCLIVPPGTREVSSEFIWSWPERGET
ncbi:MAG TPA: alginate lyase family protein [Roseiarcus sp.]|nr:alginate lyase family protein [Roseiarcus sp.]